MALLFIYDATESGAVGLVNEARKASVRLPVGSAQELTYGLDNLLASGRSFDRILFQTHGSPGTIFLGRDAITPSWWRGAASRGWARLSSGNARLYFNGCNVAEGRSGWAFLEAAAGVFLKPGGGEVFGQTSKGIGNVLNGHVVHLWGATRTLHVATDGRVIERFEQ